MASPADENKKGLSPWGFREEETGKQPVMMLSWLRTEGEIWCSRANPGQNVFLCSQPSG